ncbi:chromosome segregation protein SMC [Siminovitchia sediminis]|uniref:Chromosome partition protein Smc n=1 Tax=Siminovitchia sediminis TaxID=1274353 RepID=A0ABW4KFN5_9BACI
MFLKQLNMYGFKSFAEKTEMEFVPGVTAVVGPNGSGKSNVTDALRWVLGEQSAKSLRGGTMEDIIFAGSDSRKPLNYAEVSITLDNETGSLPVDYSEVNVKRRVFRTGESEFFINEKPCRLKDIVELFTDSGLGREAFSIIGQGKVDQVLNSKPEERRTIFEEAAGVLKYKHRKKKTEDKLLETEENLQRVDDILHELEGQLEILKEQADRAEQFLQMKGELKKVETALIVRKLEELYVQWEKVNNEVELYTDAEIKLSKDIQNLELDIDKKKQQQNITDEKINSLQEKLVDVSELLEKLEGQRQVLEEKSRNIVRNMDMLQVNIKEAQSKKEELLHTQKETESLISQKKAETQNIHNQLLKIEQSLGKLDDTLDQTIENLKSEYVDAMNEQASYKNEIQYIEKQLGQHRIRLEKLRSDKEKDEAELNLILTELKEKETKLTHIQKQLRSLTEKNEQYTEKRAVMKNQRENLQSELFQLYRETQKMKAEQESLEMMEDDYAGYMQGVREVLKAKRTLSGIEGTAADLIQVPKELETAVETALGAAVQHIVVQTDTDGRKAIEFLKKKRLGRATFLPLNVIQPKYFHSNYKEAMKSHPSFLGTASDLVTYDKKHEPAIRHLLGSIVVAKDLKGAGELAKLTGYKLRIVTLTGDVINAGGSMTGGTSKQKRTSLISRKNRLESVKKNLFVQKQKITTAESELTRLKEKMTECEKLLSNHQNKIKELEAVQYELQSDKTQLKIQLKHVKDALSLNEVEQDGLLNDIQELKLQSEQSHTALMAREQSIRQLDEEIKQLAETRISQQSSKDQLLATIHQLNLQKVQLEEQMHAANSNLERIRSSLVETDSFIKEAHHKWQAFITEKESLLFETTELEEQIKIKQAEKEKTLQLISDSRRMRLDIQEDIKHCEAELKELARQQKKLAEKLKNEEFKGSRLKMEMENLAKTLTEDFAISFERARKESSSLIDVPEAEKKRDSLKKELSAVGTVNVGAIDEYKRVSRRCQFLHEQRDDLLKAKSTLYEIMDEMDQEMIKRFGSTFHSIQNSFQGVFSSLFGGGRAELKLTDPDDLLNTGVEIVAQPPGKKLQNLSLLSGGERSLTAIALLFSILKVRPVPFCVLDEVEAALDEANVDRFSRYLKKFSENTQFIVITHRQGTMAGADVLYGITMQESGVSKLVSVKLEESRAMAKLT